MRVHELIDGCPGMRPSLHSHRALAALWGRAYRQGAAEQQSKMLLMSCTVVQSMHRVRMCKDASRSDHIHHPCEASPGQHQHQAENRGQAGAGSEWHSFKLPPPLHPHGHCATATKALLAWARGRACALTPACGPAPK